MTDNTNALIPISFDQLPSVQLGSNADFDEIAKASDFLGRLQLFTKGRAVNKGLVRPGHYGIPEGDDDVTDLGDSIDLLVLARKPKAIDMSDTDAVLVSYNVQDAEFKRIQGMSAEKESHCMFGPSFLVYERSTGRFLEFFCGTKSARSEAKKLFAYLPLTQSQIDAMEQAGDDVSGLEPHGPLPMTLKVKLIDKGSFSWHVPVAGKCSTPFTKLPKESKLVAEIQRFLTLPSTEVEKVEPETKRRAR